MTDNISALHSAETPPTRARRISPGGSRRLTFRFGLVILAVAAIAAVPRHATAAPTRAAASYLRSSIRPPGASCVRYQDCVPSGDFAGASIIGNAISADGVVAFDAEFPGPTQSCDTQHAFAYFPKTGRYIVFRKAPGLGPIDTHTAGIASDNSVEITAGGGCAGEELMYRVRLTSTGAHWSKPCHCGGYWSAGINSDGIALNNDQLGPAVLTFPNGSPQVTQLGVTVGDAAGAQLLAAGTPKGFAGYQTDPTTGRTVPTVWLDGKTYVLPLASNTSSLNLEADAVEEHSTRNGARATAVGTFREQSGLERGTDYWTGRRGGNGIHFVERRNLAPAWDGAYRLSTNGSMIFGFGPNSGPPLIFVTATRSEIRNGAGCGGGYAWGDSHRDILVGGKHLCLARPKR